MICIPVISERCMIGRRMYGVDVFYTRFVVICGSECVLWCFPVRD